MSTSDARCSTTQSVPDFWDFFSKGKMVDVCREKYGEITANLTQSSEPYRENDGLQHPKKSGRT
jgi:hypothetical protein